LAKLGASYISADAGGSGSGACSNGEIKDIAIVSPWYAAQPATKEVIDAFEKDAKAAGFNVTKVDTNNDLAAVNGEIENAVAQGADAVVLGMGDPQEFGAGLAATIAKNVPVIGLDAGVVDGVTANVASDNAFLGEISAQQIIDNIPAGGKVIMLHFDPFEPVRLRDAAAKALFEANGIQIIEYIQGDAADSTGFAKATVQDLLSKYPKGEVDAIWAGWDATALGAFQATQETGRTEVLVTGVDGQDFAVTEVAKGENWIATVRQDWPSIAAKAVEAISDCSKGTAPTSQLLTVPGLLITKDS
ncbi:MAG TPA: substrate-binding domain-containing protein, partial [Ilumatobacteraceae bacterium]|nr:substrate-binding domain-containing protein [Ilumatobacteraceae bacterium]